MITVDSSAIFPACPTYGFTGQPTFDVRITKRTGGFERRDGKWELPLRVFNAVPLGTQAQADIEKIYKFALIMGGTLRGYRFKDWLDYKSCDLDGTVTPMDQPFELTTGSPGGYQLIKEYAIEGIDGLTHVRPIVRPKGSTIRVANENGIEQASSTWTIDEVTGYLTPGGGFSGTPTSWGGEFYLWARFASDPEITIADFKIQSLTASIIEIRNEVPV